MVGALRGVNSQLLFLRRFGWRLVTRMPASNRLACRWRLPTGRSLFPEYILTISSESAETWCAGAAERWGEPSRMWKIDEEQQTLAAWSKSRRVVQHLCVGVWLLAQEMRREVLLGTVGTFIRMAAAPGGCGRIAGRSAPRLIKSGVLHETGLSECCV